ncbi:CopG family transcriptional regulator [Rothia sp. AR01]|uniref:CopG family transcriptional regulator n=1 Tax=Rothia santali TaxID=2949643 RepID=A0A9X2H9J0_9MICC|nr:CopG family transcriptional regulator [Rothia santali]MCP3425151.1 CopG family transcriptional regulator [Rothia santali]
MNPTPDHEALSRWAESDAMPEAIKTAETIREGTPENHAAERAMLEAVTGRPNLGAVHSGAGASPRRQVRLPKAMSDRLDAFAEAEHKKPSEVIREALEKHLPAA